ncbi:glutamyl-tRNA amidotransferase [Xanthomonas phage XacN1]|nr:glutamyl-tRNA amidotransferase [Xanthomonas phage XacN1]
MSTLEKIKADRIAAMKAGQGVRKDTLALVLAGIKQVEVDTRKELTEADVIGLLTKMAKQRQESINQYVAAGRNDLADVEIAEKVIIEEYLPQQLSEEEVRLKVAEAISATGATTMKDMGKVVALLKPDLVGKADMGFVSKLVKDSLQ